MFDLFYGYVHKHGELKYFHVVFLYQMCTFLHLKVYFIPTYVRFFLRKMLGAQYGPVGTRFVWF